MLLAKKAQRKWSDGVSFCCLDSCNGYAVDLRGNFGCTKDLHSWVSLCNSGKMGGIKMIAMGMSYNNGNDILYVTERWCKSTWVDDNFLALLIDD